MYSPGQVRVFLILLKAQPAGKCAVGIISFKDNARHIALILNTTVLASTIKHSTIIDCTRLCASTAISAGDFSRGVEFGIACADGNGVIDQVPLARAIIGIVKNDWVVGIRYCSGRHS